MFGSVPGKYIKLHPEHELVEKIKLPFTGQLILLAALGFPLSYKYLPLFQGLFPPPPPLPPSAVALQPSIWQEAETVTNRCMCAHTFNFETTPVATVLKPELL